MTRPRVPRRGLAAASILAGALAVHLVAGAPWRTVPLGLATLGGLALAFGLGRWHRDQRTIGGLAALVGALALAGGLAFPLAHIAVPGRAAEVVLGAAGVACLALGVGPARRGWEREFLAAGAGLVLLTVVLSGVLHDAGRTTLLLGGVACVLAWDVGEQAVNLGEQVGNEASARRAAFVHPAATLGVGLVAVALARGVASLGVSGLSLPVLLALLAGGLLTAFALSH
ncbi:MAG: hypothetical protein ABEJ80_06890 [Halarchaeum sp.]